MSAIERKAVREFEALFDRTECLEPSIDSGEKGKITDGYVHVFENPYNEQGDHILGQDNYVGRLNVQVKGKKLPKSGKKLRSFELTRDELKNFGRVGGVVLLVAGIPRNIYDPVEFYFADLAQSNIRLIVNSMAKTQSRKNVALSRFPTAPAEVLRLVRHLQVRQSEKSIVTPNDNLIEQAEGFTITVPSDIDWSVPQLFGGPSSSAIITVEGPNDQTQVVEAILDIIPEDYQLHRNEKLTVSCGGVEFTDTRKRRVSSKEWDLFVSPGVCLRFGEGNTADVTARTQKKLFYARKDLLFLDALNRGEWLTIDGHRAAKFKRHRSLSEFIKPLGYLSDLEELFCYFNVNPKIVDVADLDVETVRRLERLVNRLFRGATVSFEEDGPIREVVDLHDNQLQIVWCQESSDDGWIPISFFDSSRLRYAAFITETKNADEPPSPVSPFEFFSADDLGRVLNLEPDCLIDGYTRLPEEIKCYLANMTVLKLIQAADRTPFRRSELLSLALELNRWVQQEEGATDVHLLNQFQIQSRLGTLSDPDKRVLEKIRERSRKYTGNEHLEVEAASAILLGRFDGASYLMEEMNRAERERFESWPIHFLYENRDRTYDLDSTESSPDWLSVERRLEDENINRVSLYSLGLPLRK